MKKATRNDRIMAALNPNPSKIPVATYQVSQRTIIDLNRKDKSDRQVNVVCPNCQFHFKIQLRPHQSHQKGQESPGKLDESLEKLIEHQFSLISSYSRNGSLLQNSPIIKLKSQQNKQKLYKEDSVGLERLQRLNQLSQLQRSRLKDSRDTVRFKPSPKQSPMKQLQQSRQQSFSPKLLKEPQVLTQIQKSFKQLRPQEYNQDQKTTLKQKIFDYFQMFQVLTAVLDWIKANEHYNSLPSYIRLLISTCQQKLNSQQYG